MWLNARISARQNLDGTGPEIASFDSMTPLQALMVNGPYNPGQLVIVRELMAGNGGFDTTFFRDVAANYTVTTDPATGVTTVTHNAGNPAAGGLGNLSDGTDRLTHIERLQFADQSVVLVPGLNNEPVGLLTVSDTTPDRGRDGYGVGGRHHRCRTTSVRPIRPGRSPAPSASSGRLKRDPARVCARTSWPGTGSGWKPRSSRALRCHAPAACRPGHSSNGRL